MKEFIHKQFLRPVMLHELWEVAGRAHQAMEQRATGAERCATLVGTGRGCCATHGAGIWGVVPARSAGVPALAAQPCPSISSLLAPPPPHLPPPAVCCCRRAHRDLRAALAILSMAAATRPEAFSQRHVEDLLRFGFGSGSSDALITRHACITLQRLSANFKAG